MRFAQNSLSQLATKIVQKCVHRTPGPQMDIPFNRAIKEMKREYPGLNSWDPPRRRDALFDAVIGDRCWLIVDQTELLWLLLVSRLCLSLISNPEVQPC